jgi:hypothetical protein
VFAKKSRWFLWGLSVIAACPIFSQQLFAQAGSGAVAGAWKLISIDRVNADGEVIQADEWMGKKPTGLIIYDANSGYMSVQILRVPRPNLPYSSEEKADAYDAYYAYFGTYRVNETEGRGWKEGVVMHHLHGSLRPEEMGNNYPRMFKILGNRIMLTTPTLRRLTFERVEKEN